MQDSGYFNTKFDRVSIDKLRTVLQAKLEKIVSELARPGMEAAKRVNLDFMVYGPTLFTDIDLKNSVGSKILKNKVKR